MVRRLVAVLAIALCVTTSAFAAQQGPEQHDLISLGAGYMDFDKTEKFTKSTDFRLEYRFGFSILPWISSSFAGGRQEITFHPFLGVEATSRNLIYGLGGFSMDWDFSDHGIFTWNEGIGYLDSGDHRSLGNTMEFRSQAEIGYRFDDDTRITAQFSHISNAKTTRVNPGAEIIGMYVHVPVNEILGR
jgi:hypothetical protein